MRMFVGVYLSDRRMRTGLSGSWSDGPSLRQLLLLQRGRRPWTTRPALGGLLTKNCVTTNSTAEGASKMDAKSGVEDGATDHLLQEQDAHDDETRPGLEISRSGLTSNVCRTAGNESVHA